LADDARPGLPRTERVMTMKRLQLTIATMVLALASWSGAQAQVTLDVSKITCDQFTLYKITDPQNIAIWLSGYYHGARNTTTVDTQQLAGNLQKIKDYCNLHTQETVMHAVETVFGPLK
jgi:acid stress chaperone HdeB